MKPNYSGKHYLLMQTPGLEADDSIESVMQVTLHNLENVIRQFVASAPNGEVPNLVRFSRDLLRSFRQLPAWDGYVELTVDRTDYRMWAESDYHLDDDWVWVGVSE